MTYAILKIDYLDERLYLYREADGYPHSKHGVLDDISDTIRIWKEDSILDRTILNFCNTLIGIGKNYKYRNAHYIRKYLRLTDYTYNIKLKDDRVEIIINTEKSYTIPFSEIEKKKNLKI